MAKLKGKKKAEFLKRMAAGRKKAARSNSGKKRKSTARKSPTMRRVPNEGTGWIRADRVKIVKKRGKPAEVLIQKPKKRKKR